MGLFSDNKNLPFTKKELDPHGDVMAWKYFTGTLSGKSTNDYKAPLPQLLSYLVDFKALQKLWNPLSKTIPGKS